MADTTERIIHIESANFATLQNQQIAVMDANDAELGWRMWGGKDGAGTITYWLAKDQAARVTDLYLKDTTPAGTTRTRVIHADDMDCYWEMQQDYHAWAVCGLTALAIYGDAGSPARDYIDVGVDMVMNGNEIQSDTGQDLIFELGDNAGANVLSVQDSDDAEIFKLDSDGALYVKNYVYCYDDTNTYELWQEDRYTLVVNGLTMMDVAGQVASPAQDWIAFAPEQSPDADIYVGFGTEPEYRFHFKDGDSGATAESNADNMVLEFLHDGGMSILASAGATARLALGEVSDPDFFELQANQDNGTVEWEQAGIEILRVEATITRFNYNGDDRDMQFTGDTLGNLFYLNAGLNAIGIGTNAPDCRFHVTHNSADTNVVREILRITHTCSGGGTSDGFGARFGFELEDQYSTLYVAGAIDVLWKDNDVGDSDMVFLTMDNSSLAEVARFTSGGQMWLSNDSLTWDANQEAAFGIRDGNYALLASISGSSGGAYLRGYTKAAAASATGVYLWAATENDPTDTGAVHVRAFKHDGAGALTALGNDAHVFTIENNTTQLLELIGDGAFRLLGDDINNQSYQVAAAGKYRIAHFDENGQLVGGDNDKANLST